MKNRSLKITEIVATEVIHSIVCIHYRNHHTLVICLKGEMSIPEFNIWGGIGYLRMNRFSYHFPAGVAIPEEYYQHISLSYWNNIPLARINKHIKFGARREMLWENRNR